MSTPQQTLNPPPVALGLELWVGGKGTFFLCRSQDILRVKQFFLSPRASTFRRIQAQPGSSEGLDDSRRRRWKGISAGFLPGLCIAHHRQFLYSEHLSCPEEISHLPAKTAGQRERVPWTKGTARDGCWTRAGGAGGEGMPVDAQSATASPMPAFAA